MNLLKSLAGPKKKEASGPLTGRTLSLETGSYRVEGVLGEGGAAVIYRAVDPASGAPFALKHFNLSGDPEAERDVMIEVSVMRALAGCPHVLRLREAAMGPAAAFLVLELCEGTLAGRLAAPGPPLSDAEVAAAFLPVARAVAALHALPTPMAHRDVKAENVLRRGDGAWVLCDFGSATAEQKVYASPVEIAREEERIRKHTTPAYRAPELWDLWDRRFVGLAVDVWALGCLLYLLAYGGLPFDGDSKLQALNGAYAAPPRGARPAGVADLVAACLVVDPVGRISAAEVVARAERMMAGGAGGGGGGGAAAGGPMGAAAARTAAGAAPAAEDDTWGREFDAVAPAQRAQTVAPAAAEPGGGWADFGSTEAAAAANGAAAIAAAPAPAAAPTRRPSAAPPSTELGGLRLGPGSGSAPGGNRAAQLREHCQVLEQLLEERNAEVATLRAAAAARAEEEATAAAARDAEVAALRSEVAALRARAEEAAAAAALRRQRSGSGSGSGSGSLASFPVVGEAEETPARALGGAPMRPGSAMGRISPQMAGPAPGGRRDSFFGDLNPLG